jgi:hypothetical protein
MRRRIVALLAMVVIAVAMMVAMVAMAAPAFAAQPLVTGSFAKLANEQGFGPKQGANFGQCKEDLEGPGNGAQTAEGNPSLNGGEDFSTDEGIDAGAVFCSKS